MTRIGKILAVFVTVASLCFVGFAIATVFGGPDWESVMREDYFKAYRISRAPAPDRTWTAIRGSDEQQVASSKVLPEVLGKVIDEVHQNNQTRIQALQQRLPALEARVADLTTAEEADRKALEQYVAQRRQELQQIRQQESDTAIQVVAATNEAQKLENLIAARREDILRLKQQVQELKADLFRLTEIQSQIVNLQHQISGNLNVARLRNQLLKERSIPSVTDQTSTN